MISVTCDCGKTLRAKDELAGRRVKCPACSKPLTIPDPATEEEDDFSDPWDDESESVPAPAPRARPKSASSGSSKKSAKGKAKSSKTSGGGSTRNKIFGGIGILWGGGILLSFFARGMPMGGGAHAVGALAGLAFGVVMLAAGIYTVTR